MKMILLTLVSFHNDHHWPQFSHGLRINENPACPAPVAPSPAPAALSHSSRPSSQHPVNWDEPIAACWWVDGIAPLVNLHCMSMTILFNCPAAWVLAKLGAYLLPWVSLLLPRAWLHSWQALARLPGFSFLRLLQPHLCLTPQEISVGSETCPVCTCTWALLGHIVVLTEHHLPDEAVAEAGFPEPSCNTQAWT